MSWLVLNTGSSSLKFALFGPEVDAGEPPVSGAVHWHGTDAKLTLRQGDGPEQPQPCDARDPAGAASAAIRAVLATGVDPKSIRGVGHRIVHGGPKFTQSVRIDDAVRDDIEDVTPLAPLHNPPALAGLDAAQKALPGVSHVAVFDTTFFRDLPPESATLPVPKAWADDWGIRRYGFHGISHAYCAEKAAAILGRDSADPALKLVVCHLGNGCSASAVRGGTPDDTTMSFTPLDGLMMGTRPGSLDPSIVLYLLKEKKLDVAAIEDALNHKSGLLGVSGVSSDYREVEEAADEGPYEVSLALMMYEARIRAAIGALAATLGGIDALVFAGGVGENSVSLRRQVCITLGFMGIRLDEAKIEANPVDADIAADDSAVRVLVIHTREELMIAREVARLVGPE